MTTERARELSREVTRLFEERRFAEALPVAREWVALDPGAWFAHADLAVAAKHAGAFEECRAATVRAVELGGAAVDAGVHWNAGIAATALGDWALARRSWAACGLDVPAGEGPIHWALGHTPIRISPHEHAEVVWCSRICPARAIIRSIPLPESGHRCGDVVLHDGEPRGKRLLNGREVSVFDELAVLERSPYQTLVLEIDADAPAHVTALEDVLTGTIAGFEDWTASIETICAACSEGRPHEHHERVEAPWKRERRIAIAVRDDVDERLLRSWETAAAGRRVRQILTTEAPA